MYHIVISNFQNFFLVEIKFLFDVDSFSKTFSTGMRKTTNRDET